MQKIQPQTPQSPSVKVYLFLLIIMSLSTAISTSILIDPSLYSYATLILYSENTNLLALWLGHLSHWDIAHLVTNLMGLVIIEYVFSLRIHLLIILFIISPILSLLIIRFSPEYFDSYRGLSSILWVYFGAGITLHFHRTILFVKDNVIFLPSIWLIFINMILIAYLIVSNFYNISLSAFYIPDWHTNNISHLLGYAIGILYAYIMILISKLSRPK